MEVIRTEYCINPNLDIFQQDDLYKNHYLGNHSIRENLLIELENRLLNYISIKTQEYKEYWTNHINEDYNSDQDKPQCIKEWKEKIEKALVHESAYNGKANTSWCTVQYGGKDLKKLNRLIDKSNPINELLKYWSIGDLIAVHTLRNTKIIVENLTESNVTKPHKTSEILTFNWIGKKSLDEAYKIINGKVFSTDLDTFKMIFSKVDVLTIVNPISINVNYNQLIYFIQMIMTPDRMIIEKHEKYIQATVSIFKVSNENSLSTALVNINKDSSKIKKIDRIINSLKS